MTAMSGESTVFQMAWCLQRLILFCRIPAEYAFFRKENEGWGGTEVVRWKVQVSVTSLMPLIHSAIHSKDAANCMPLAMFAPCVQILAPKVIMKVCATYPAP